MVLTDIIPFVQAQIKLCPLPMVMLETRYAAKKFLDDTRAWDDTASSIRLESFRTRYTMDSVTGSKVSNVYKVWLVERNDEGAEVSRRRLACVIGDNIGAPEARVKNVSPDMLPAFWSYRNDMLNVWPVGEVNKDLTIEADVCLTIDGKNPRLPDWLDEHEIAYGALGRLYAIAGQDWFNADLANYYEDKFEKAIASKRIERLHGGKPGSMTLMSPQFGGYF